MPRLDPDDRKLRDARILRLFLTGWTMTDIAKHPKVQLSRKAVDQAIRRQLALDGPDRRVLSDAARSVYVARSEMLLSKLMPKAVDPFHPEQIRAFEACRRLLEQQARFYGLLGVRGADDEDGLPAPASVLSLDDYRGRYRGRPRSQAPVAGAMGWSPVSGTSQAQS
jgi:hypothetical protein